LRDDIGRPWTWLSQLETPKNFFDPSLIITGWKFRRAVVREGAKVRGGNLSTSWRPRVESGNNPRAMPNADVHSGRCVPSEAAVIAGGYCRPRFAPPAVGRGGVRKRYEQVRPAPRVRNGDAAAGRVASHRPNSLPTRGSEQVASATGNRTPSLTVTISSQCPIVLGGSNSSGRPAVSFDNAIGDSGANIQTKLIVLDVPVPLDFGRHERIARSDADVDVALPNRHITRVGPDRVSISTT